MLVRIFLSCYVSSFLFRFWFGEYEILNPTNLDAMIEFFLNGMALAALVTFSFVWVIYDLVRFGFASIYFYRTVPKFRRKILGESATDQEIRSISLPYHKMIPDFIKGLFENNHLIKKVNDQWVIEDSMLYEWKNYLENPLAPIAWSINVLSFIYLTTITFFVASRTLMVFESFAYILVLTSLFLTLIYLAVVARLCASINALIPNLKTIPVKARSEAEDSDIQPDSSTQDVVEEVTANEAEIVQAGLSSQKDKS